MYGILLHIVVLFFNLILMINLLIAIMADKYSILSEVRTGIFWAKVVQEMPKHAYDKHYGALNMLPFYFSWLSILVSPALLYFKDNKTLKAINRTCFIIVYLPFSLILLLMFCSVNLILLPFAYFKTIAHKAVLFSRYRSPSHLKNLLIFIPFGIPILLIAQFPDAVNFMRQTYSRKIRKQHEQGF